MLRPPDHPGPGFHRAVRLCLALCLVVSAALWWDAMLQRAAWRITAAAVAATLGVVLCGWWLRSAAERTVRIDVDAEAGP